MLGRVAPLPRLPGEPLGKRARDGRAPRGRADRAAFALDGDDLGRLAVPSRRIGEHLGDDLLAAERDDEDRADVRVAAVGRERVVRDAHVGPELAAAGQVRQRRRRLGAAAAAMRSATTGGADHRRAPRARGCACRPGRPGAGSRGSRARRSYGRRRRASRMSRHRLSARGASSAVQPVGARLPAGAGIEIAAAAAAGDVVHVDVRACSDVGATPARWGCRTSPPAARRGFDASAILWPCGIALAHGDGRRSPARVGARPRAVRAPSRRCRAR